MLFPSVYVCVFVCCEIMLKARQKRKLVSCSYCAENNGETDRWGGGERWILCVFVLVCLNVCVCVRLLYLCDVASVRNG